MLTQHRSIWAERIDCCRRIRPRFQRQMSSWLSAVVLLLQLAAQTLSLPTQQQVRASNGIVASRATATSTALSSASNLCAPADVTTCPAFVGPRVPLSFPRGITSTTSTTSTSNSSSDNRLQGDGGIFGYRDCSRRRQIPWRGSRGRCVEAMDVDGPDVDGGAKRTAELGRGVSPWQAEARAALERPNVEMPQVYQVPGNP